MFSVEREYMKGDDIDLSYNNIGDLLSVTPGKWLSSGNLVLNSAVNGLNDSRTKPVKKVMALDRMHNLLKPSFISPFIFGSILVMYSIARSKMAVNICFVVIRIQNHEFQTAVYSSLALFEIYKLHIVSVSEK